MRLGGESIVKKLITFSIIITLLIFSVTTAYGFGSRPSKKILPSVNAGQDQIIEEGSIATLDGSATTDPDSSIRSYLWTQLSGPSVTFSNFSTIKSTFIVPKVSSDGSILTFKLTVTDRRGLQTSDTCVVTISYINKPPVADAGKIQEVLEGDTVSLSAAKSNDPDDGIQSYRWSQSSGTSVVLSSRTSLTPSFYVPDVGKEGDSLKFKLTVLDNGGLTSSASCIVNVINKNKAPVADAGAAQSLAEGTTVMLNGAKSSDIDGDKLSYLWSQTDGTKVVLSDPSIVTPSFNTPDVGTGGAALKFKLIVTDQEGASSTDTCLVNVLFVNKAPVAEAGDNQTVKEGDIAKLNAGGSTDADDGIVSYLWEQVAGPDVKLSDPFEKSPSFITPDVGEDGVALTFRLIVTDQAGLKSTDACIVNVSFVNAPPVAKAGVTQIVSEGSLTTLNAGNSIDTDGNIQSYLWTQIDGPEVKLSSLSSVRPIFIAPDTDVEGVSLTFKVTVSDTGGLASSDTCSVKVVFVNQAPVAEAGIFQTVEEGSRVTLDATGSADPDNGIQSYLWTKIAGPDVTLSSTSSITPEFIAPDVDSEGISLTFQLIVTDNSGLQSSDACIVNVTFINSTPVAEAGEAQSVSESTKVTLDGSQSFDPDGEIVSYLWKQIGGPLVTFSNDTEISPEFLTPGVGIEGIDLTFQLTVADTGGLQSIDTCVVSVNYINTPPVADAGDDQTVSEGIVVTLSGVNSTDSDDGIDLYKWEQISGPDVDLPETATMTPSFTAIDVGDDGGALIFKLTVTDYGGLQSSDTCSVDVNFINEPPIAKAGVDQIVAEGGFATLNGGGSTDSDDGIESYLWEQTIGPDVTLSDTSSVNPTFMAPSTSTEGTILIFRLTVIDKGGLQSTDPCTVNVSYVNKAPVAEAGSAQTVDEGSAVTLSGVGSSDPDDGIKSYFWEKIAGPDVLLSSTSSVNPTFTAPDVGVQGISLTFQLIVTDNEGLQSSDATIVNVTFVNTAPVADAGANQVMTEKTLVTLNAGNSSDFDDGIETYEWSQIEGPDVVLSDNSVTNPTFEAPTVSDASTTLKFKVIVTDTRGLQSSDTSTVTITSAGGGSITLEWDTNEDADYYVVYWGQISGDYIHNSPDIESPTTSYIVSGLVQAPYYFAVKAFNSCGNSSDFSTEITHNLTGGNVSPVADAGPDQTVIAGVQVNLTGLASTDPDDGIASYQWTQVSGTSVTLVNNSSINTSFTVPDSGTTGSVLTFRLTVTDFRGLQSSDTSLVNIQGAGSGGGSSVALQWDTNSDADYYIVYWGKNSKNYTAQSEQVKSPKTTFTVSGLDASIYYFAVKAFNDCGNSSDFSTEIIHNLASVSNVVTSSTGTKPVTQTGIVQPLPDGVPTDGKTADTDDDMVQPISPENLVSFLTNNPSIEFIDSDFKHLEWIQTGWAEYNNLNGEVRIATGDIDGDGEDEIIIGFGRVPGNIGIPGGFFQILNHDFTHLAWGQINWPEYNSINGETWPTCGDIDDDGDDEIIIGLGEGGEGTIEIFDYDSNGLFHIEWVISSWSEYNSLIGETRPTTGDIDGDGFDEIVVGFASQEENNSMPNGYFEIIESDYTHATWGSIEWSEYNTLNGETWLSCGDITGNGSYEIIAGLGSGSNGQVEIFEYQSNEALHVAWFQVDWPEYNSLNGETRPAASDIDNDSKDEIIIGLGPVNGNTSIPGGMYQVNDDDYSLLEWLQIDWTTYNTVNGSTRPVSAIINDKKTMLIGLGEK